MLFRQLFDRESCTYTYLLASRAGGEALIIDPVLDHTEHYLRLIAELRLKLVIGIDTHTHGDHITALGRLSDATECITMMGDRSKAECVTARFREGERIGFDGICLRAIYTPGHTDESFSLVTEAQPITRLFTGDVLLIRGTGRTDFQNGNPVDAYDSIFNKLLKFPDDTLICPAHDYNGNTVSTIAEERAYNPRLQVQNVDEYVAIMNSLRLPNPRMMEIAVPANLRCGRLV